MSMDLKPYILLKNKVNQSAEAISAIETALETYPSGFSYKGDVASVNDLPSSGNEKGDLYVVTGEDNAEYIWNGTTWVARFIAITNEQIDSLYS